MSDNKPIDPMSTMRSALDHWEKLANEYGAQFLQRPQTSEAMQKMTAGYLQVQKMAQDAMGKSLAAANLPSRLDIEAISARLGAIEASLSRLEAAGGTAQPGAASRPGPPRTRKPAPRS